MFPFHSLPPSNYLIFPTFTHTHIRSDHISRTKRQHTALAMLCNVGEMNKSTHSTALTIPTNVVRPKKKEERNETERITSL